MLIENSTNFELFEISVYEKSIRPNYATMCWRQPWKGTTWNGSFSLRSATKKQKTNRWLMILEWHEVWDNKAAIYTSICGHIFDIYGNRQSLACSLIKIQVTCVNTFLKTITSKVILQQTLKLWHLKRRYTSKSCSWHMAKFNTPTAYCQGLWTAALSLFHGPVAAISVFKGESLKGSMWLRSINVGSSIGYSFSGL